MEGIRGKDSFTVDRATLLGLTLPHGAALLDIGTGDGRYVSHVARANPDCFAVGLDACRENLRRTSRLAPPNALYVIANALALPEELSGWATRLTINFPWGSLLEGLAEGREGLYTGLTRAARPGSTLDIRLNAGALSRGGWPAQTAAGRVCDALHCLGWRVSPPVTMSAEALRRFPSQWARQLAYGPSPRGINLRAVYAPAPHTRGRARGIPLWVPSRPPSLDN
ncbi:MAG: hypothetical protein JOZ41_21075 [Chloroflexi bacterium]|nr:hypothetical protein [Chloroflexota bacterium]